MTNDILGARLAILLHQMIRSDVWWICLVSADYANGLIASAPVGGETSNGESQKCTVHHCDWWRGFSLREHWHSYVRC